MRIANQRWRSDMPSASARIAVTCAEDRRSTAGPPAGWRPGSRTARAARHPSRRCAGCSSCVRDAFVASQACTAPPVRFQSIQLSTVPAQSSPRAPRARAVRDRVEQPAHLASRRTADRSSGRSARSSCVCRPRSRSVSQNAVVRRHCQTMHGPSGTPVRAPRASTDSRWLVTATAAISATVADARQSAIAVLDAAPDGGGILLDPAGCGKRRSATGIAMPARTTTGSASSNRSTFVFVVPLVDREDVPARHHGHAAASAATARRRRECPRRRGRSDRAGTPANPSARRRPGRRACASAPDAIVTTTSATALPRPP